MSTLAYHSADTLGMTIYDVEGRLRGKELRKIPFGPWRVELPVEAISDLQAPLYITYWITVGHLRCYFVVREKEHWWLVLDASVLAGIGNATGFDGDTLAARWDQIKSAVRKIFRWSEGSKEWDIVAISTLPWN